MINIKLIICSVREIFWHCVGHSFGGAVATLIAGIMPVPVKLIQLWNGLAANLADHKTALTGRTASSWRVS